MKRYHFHLFDGQSYTWDEEGTMLPDLTAVVAKAEARVRLAMRTGTGDENWTTWKIDVRGQDDITIFHYPFEEVETRSTAAHNTG